MAIEEMEFKIGEEKLCEDCQRDRDYCPDCNGDLYKSPDSYEKYMEDR